MRWMLNDGPLWAGGLRNPPVSGGAPPVLVTPAFTIQPSLTGSTALGGTITVALGAASGVPAPALTGTLTRPGKAAAAVADGDTFTVEAADQGGTITLDVTAVNSAGSATASAVMDVPAGAPTVTVPDDGGNKLSTTASITPEGEITINHTSSHLTGDLGVTHYMVRADNMAGRTLKVVRGPGAIESNDLAAWQMAWTHDPHGDWLPFDSVTSDGAGTLTGTKAAPLTLNTVYVARRPVFTNTRWDRAIARWKANPLTGPTASGNADFRVGTLPANQYAPQMDVFGFKVGTGPKAIVLTGNTHVDEHIGAYAFEAFVDYILTDTPEAAGLRDKLTFYVYPKFNPQARYAGASRVEVTTSTNANRMFAVAYDHIPLSKVMRDVWAADLPATVEGVLDFHDYASTAAGRGAVYHTNAAALLVPLQDQYFSRTGANVIVQPSSAGSESIAGYFLNNHAAAWGVAVEHGTTLVDDVVGWQAWGREMAAALRAHYGTDMVPSPWQEMEWVPADANVAVSRDANQDWLIVGTNRNPVASILIPAGSTIEVLFSGNGGGSNGAYIRQGPSPDLPGATSTTIGTSVHGGDFFRRVTVTYDPARRYVGLIKGGLSGATRTLRMYSHTRWRVLP